MQFRWVIVMGLAWFFVSGGISAAPDHSVPQERLLLWLDASDGATFQLDGDRVVGWRSKAPGPECVLSSVGPERPILRPTDGLVRAAVRFDGIDDVLRNTEFSRSAETWTLIAVLAPSRPQRGGGICTARSRDGHDYDPGFTVDLYGSTAAFDQLSVEGAGRMGGQLDQMTSTHPFGELCVVTVERDHEEIRLFVNGVAEGTRPVVRATTQMDEIRVGARQYAGSERQFLNGDIAQVLLYDRILPASTRAGLERPRIAGETEQHARRERAMVEERKRLADRMQAPVVVDEWTNEKDFLASGKHGLPDVRTVADLQRLPIRTDLRHAIALSVNHLNSLFDADRDDEPFFFSNRRADGTGEMLHSVHIGIPHVVGRCLVGSAIAELATGLPAPNQGLAILERYCARSFDNPDYLNSYFDPSLDNGRFVEFHNLREGLYGLWALGRLKDSAWAKEAGGNMLEVLAAITDETGRWSTALMEPRGMTDHCSGVSVPNAGRMVDPLLAIHRLTGSALAMDLAGQYAKAALEEVFTVDGAVTPMPRSSGHLHSVTSALSGVVDYAIETGDEEMLDHCRRIIDVGLPEYFSSWGWGDEVSPDHPADELSRGEINQTGDVIRAALLLGQAGYPDYYDLAERYLRSMLLPTQHREDNLRAILRENENPKSDSERDMLRRSIGGFAMQLPNDRMRKGDWPISTLDITSGAVHAMSECCLHQCVRDGETWRVNLLLDYDGEELRIDSYLPLEGKIEFQSRGASAVAIRIPPWVEQKAVEISVGGRPAPPRFDGGYVVITRLASSDRGTVRFPLRYKVEKETVDGITYTTTWIGNQIVNILPRGTESPLPF